jgi:site-specific recombinase XerD
MNGIENKRYQTTIKEVRLQPIVDEFKAFLENEKVSESTLKNYISDIRQFVNWLEKNPTYAQSN